MNDRIKKSGGGCSRRQFLGAMGTTAAGLLVAPYLRSANVFAYGHEVSATKSARVAITQADSYTRSLVKQKVQHLIESIGGIGDVVKAGDKVAIKINLVGGGGDPDHMWTHPEVLRAVGELIIDAGVKAQDIYIVEALWNTSSYNNYGYLAVQQSLGVQMVNLNVTAPYSNFISVPVGSNSFHYTTFTMNQILRDVNVYVSIPKMKQHYEAGLSASLKNQVGIVPMQHYLTWNTGRRDALHTRDGTQSSTTHLPKSVCDLNLARAVHLAVVDGIKNARGGEGTWNPTFRQWEDHALLAGKDPVATDSIAAYLMGNDPEAAQIRLPSGGYCTNYLEMLRQKGVGTNLLNEIEVVGDGAQRVTSVRPEDEAAVPHDFRLFQNYPNPFNPSTTIRFYLPETNDVTIKIYGLAGQEIETLVEGRVPAGHHRLHWNGRNLPTGVYIYNMQAGKYRDSKKMIYQK